MAEATDTTEANEKDDKSFLHIQAIYAKDISFESPNSPQIFRSNDFNLNMDMQLKVGSEKIEENIIEIIVQISLHAKNGEQSAYMVEIQQAGIFHMGGYNGWEQLNWLMHVYCPGIIFPYARAEVARLITQGGFPPYHLEPINFDAMYKQQLQAKASQQDNPDNQ
jgi:preprotein translocase subunit SecB